MKAKFFVHQNENLQEITNEQMQQAYEIFITKAVTLNQSGTDYQKIFRLLNFTCIEF